MDCDELVKIGSNHLSSIPITKNPFLSNKGSGSPFSAGRDRKIYRSASGTRELNSKTAAKSIEIIKSPSMENAKTINCTKGNTSYVISSFKPEGKFKVHVPSPITYKIYDKLKTEIKLEINSIQASNKNEDEDEKDYHFLQSLKYKLENFGLSVQATYAKNLPLHSSYF